jgi:hypothetical protein
VWRTVECQTWRHAGCLWRGGRTFREPLIQAGFVIFARNGMLPTLVVRETQLSGVLVNVRSDMCV